MPNGDRWNKRLQFTHKNQLREPDPAEFIKFVDKETDLVNDPLYSEGAVDQNIERKERERVSERGSDDSRQWPFNYKKIQRQRAVLRAHRAL